MYFIELNQNLNNVGMERCTRPQNNVLCAQCCWLFYPQKWFYFKSKSTKSLLVDYRDKFGSNNDAYDIYMWLSEKIQPLCYMMTLKRFVFFCSYLHTWHRHISIFIDDLANIFFLLSTSCQIMQSNSESHDKCSQICAQQIIATRFWP